MWKRHANQIKERFTNETGQAKLAGEFDDISWIPFRVPTVESIDESSAESTEESTGDSFETISSSSVQSETEPDDTSNSNRPIRNRLQVIQFGIEHQGRYIEK